MRDVVSTNTGFNNSNDTTSTVLRDIFIGAPVALFGTGALAKDEHERDAGLLAGQAMVNAYVTDFAIKFVFLRERPQTASARGHFFKGDAASDPSFVSGHSIVAWSSAAALAESYSRPWQQVAIYTMATGVSLTRVLAQQHFPTETCSWDPFRGGSLGITWPAHIILFVFPKHIELLRLYRREPQIQDEHSVM